MSSRRLPTENLSFDTPVYDSEYKKTIKAVDILAPGTLFIEDIEGKVVSYPFSAFVAAGGAYSCFPYRLECRVNKIVGDGSGSVGDGVTGTDIALTDLRILH